MIHPTNPNAIRVKRDGPRGWHWIDRSQFRPAEHELLTDEPAAPVAPAVVEQPKKGKRK